MEGLAHTSQGYSTHQGSISVMGGASLKVGSLGWASFELAERFVSQSSSPFLRDEIGTTYCPGSCVGRSTIPNGEGIYFLLSFLATHSHNPVSVGGLEPR